MHRLADAEATEATRWYDDRDPRVARRFADEYQQALSDVARQPDLLGAGPTGDRRRLLDGFPYAIVYAEMPGVWLVLAVAHAKRRPGYWRRRATRP